MLDEAMLRLLAYDGRRYWLRNGWSLRFQIREAPPNSGRPHCVKYSLTLHDATGLRLLGFDNAHAVLGATTYDHEHRFRSERGPLPYRFQDADRLLVDFFDAVERACRLEGVAPGLMHEDFDTSEEDDDGDEQESR